jgi:hypothetical protein
VTSLGDPPTWPHACVQKAAAVEAEAEKFKDLSDVEKADPLR